MALDEPNENDEQYEISGFKYLVDKQLLKEVQPITIDFIGYGFKIDAGVDLGGGGCGSGTCSC
jgi:Fe-S cluster assembly iron-binding protein IscA